MKTNPFPPAAIAAFAAGLDDYRLTTSPEERNPHGAAKRAAEHLVSSGWEVRIPGTNRTGSRRGCPVCTTKQLVNSNGQLRRHGAPGNACAGSGALPVPQLAA